MDTVWSRVKRNSQYQQEEVQDWASYFEHLQSIFQKFDADGALKKSDLIRFFWEGLKPLVKAQMEQRGWELDSWEQLIEKAIETEAKAGLQPSFILREMDQRCHQGNRPAHTTVAKSQASAFSAQDPQTDASTEKALAPDKPPYSLRSKHGKTFDKKARKEKKKKQRQRDTEQAGKDSTLATGINTSSSAVGRTSSHRKDPSLITCYNCNKKGHYAFQCTKPKKDGSKN